MKILSIETSCDETAVSIVDAKGGIKLPTFTILGNGLFSQAHLHAKYGGVFPNLAKREHTKNILPMMIIALKEARLLKKKKRKSISEKKQKYIESVFLREQNFVENLITFFSTYKKPNIDYIAVTTGPGLEPALWVGVNTAKILSQMWNIPIIKVNHMEGHILSAMLREKKNKTKIKGKKISTLTIPKIKFPAIALLISGGHTEIVLMKSWLSYKILGATRDDAVGEAFDKVARMLKLPYPGGPEISKLSSTIKYNSKHFKFPRPMINSGDFDFSFSGIKTAVLYTIKKIPRVTKKMKAEIAHEFEVAVTEVLVSKTVDAIEKTKSKTLIVGGGVSANKRIRKTFENTIKENLNSIDLFIPNITLSTDNAIMIAISAYMQLFIKSKSVAVQSDTQIKRITASGNMKL